MATLTLPALDLFRGTRSVATSAGDKSIPGFAHVIVETGDGLVRFVATNRNLLTVAEVTVPQSVAGFRATPMAGDLLRVVKKPRVATGAMAQLAQLDVDDKFLTISTGLGVLEEGLHAERVDQVVHVPLSLDPIGFSWQALLDSFANTAAGPRADLMVINAGYLAKLATAGSFVHDSIRVFIPPAPASGPSAVKPVKLTAASDGLRWTALVMPIRVPEAAS